MVLQTRSVIQISEKTALQTNKNPERFFSLPPPFLGPITYHRSRERVFIVRRLFGGLVRYCFFRGSGRKLSRRLPSLPWKLPWPPWKLPPLPWKLPWKPWKRWKLPRKLPRFRANFRAAIAVETSSEVSSGSFRGNIDQNFPWELLPWKRPRMSVRCPRFT